MNCKGAERKLQEFETVLEFLIKKPAVLTFLGAVIRTMELQMNLMYNTVIKK